MTGLRIDVADLRREMQVGFARLDGRMDSQQERMEKLLEKGLRDQTRFPLSLGLYGLGLLNKTQTADYSWSVIMAGPTAPPSKTPATTFRCSTWV